MRQPHHAVAYPSEIKSIVPTSALRDCRVSGYYRHSGSGAAAAANSYSNLETVVR